MVQGVSEFLHGLLQVLILEDQVLGVAQVQVRVLIAPSAITTSDYLNFWMSNTIICGLLLIPIR